MNAWDDPRITRGMQKQLADRRARIAAGEKPIGWKVGLGTKAAMEKLGTRMPLVGYMMEKSVVPNGATVSVRDWIQPVAEPEIAVYMAADLAVARAARRLPRRSAPSVPQSNLRTFRRRRAMSRPCCPATFSTAPSSSGRRTKDVPG
jgi:hypothetical protein